MYRAVPGNYLSYSELYLTGDSATMYPYRDFEEYRRNKKFTNFEGVHTGVPTRTTPTLTPTTLRNIEQTFIELQSETERSTPRINEAGFVPPLIEPQPQVRGSASLQVCTNGNMSVSMVDKSWLSGSTTISSTPTTAMTASVQRAASALIAGSGLAPPPPAAVQHTVAPRRSGGGRRPNKNANISAEEEERRQVRRERNKLAAARCRKRRLDHTNELVLETEGLEQKRQSLQNEIHQLQMEKDELEFILEAHNATCRLHLNANNTNGSLNQNNQHQQMHQHHHQTHSENQLCIKRDVNDDDEEDYGEEDLPPTSPPEYKPTVLYGNENSLLMGDDAPLEPRCDAAVALSSAAAVPRRPQQHAATSTSLARKPTRPSSLPVRVPTKVEIVNGVAITTPSSIIPLNFDSIMNGGTGLTPVTSTALSPIVIMPPNTTSCSTQQRNNINGGSSMGINNSDPLQILSPDNSFPPKLVSL